MCDYISKSELIEQGQEGRLRGCDRVGAIMISYWRCLKLVAGNSINRYGKEESINFKMDRETVLFL